MKRTFLVVVGLVFSMLASAVEVFPVTGANAAGRVGDRVFVNLTYNYGAAFSVIVEDFQFTYQFANMTFVPEASTIDMLQPGQTLHQYADAVRVFAQAHQGGVLENLNPTLTQPELKGYAMSFYTADGIGHGRSGLVHLSIAFDILPSATPGPKLVSFTTANVIVDVAETEYGYPAALRNMAVVVTAVPEPGVALMLLSGLVLLGARALQSSPRVH